MSGIGLEHDTTEDTVAPPKPNRTNPDKVKRAAAHPARPGAGCKAPPATFVPVVDRGRCEGKGDCVEVCPYDVFDVRRIDKVDYDRLGFGARLKVRIHGMKTAYTPRADLCLACGLCVVACPEDAIRLSAVA
jgi:4Fe-4S ferredoxin